MLAGDLVAHPPTHPFGRRALRQAPEDTPKRVAIVRMGQLDRTAAHHFFRSIARGNLAGRRHERGDAVQVERQDDIGRVFGHQAIARFAVLQRRLRLAAGGQILDLGDVVARRAVRIVDTRNHQLDPDDRAVLAKIALVHSIAGDQPVTHLSHQLQVGVQVVLVGDGLEVQGQQLFARIADQRA